MISIACTCGADYHLADDLAGRKFRCSKCGELILAPVKAGRRRRGSSPLLLTAGHTIEERLDRETEEATTSELWRQPVKYLAGSGSALLFAAGWLGAMTKMRPVEPVARTNAMTALLSSVPLTWFVSGLFAALAAVLFVMAVVSYVSLRNELLVDD